MTEQAAAAPLLQYQLEMLKLETQVANETIRQMDDISKNLKEWAITVWAAGVGGALVTKPLAAYVSMTAVVPLLFWLVDTQHHVIQRKFIWRVLRLCDFLNGEALETSLAAGRLVGFSVMDLSSRRERSAEYHQFIRFERIACFPTLSILYGGLTLMSLGLGVLTWWWQ